MSRKRVKQYLTLLMAIGVIAVVAGGGSGTFASFNAEVTNTGNTFATGSLVLNDNGGTTTCTSAGNSNNTNNASTNGCDTLFTLSKLDDPATTLSANANASDTTLTVNAITGANIDKGDTLTITQGVTTETVTASAPADIGATSISVSALANSYTTGATVTDDSATYYAKLTLSNAGTIDATDIKFEQTAACSTTAQEGTTTLSSGLTAGTAYTTLSVNALSGSFSTGDPVVVTDGSTHTQTFVASADAANGATSISVVSQKANFSYASSSAVSGPSFGSGDLCGALKLSIIETDSSFDHSSPAAEGCAYGTTLATYGCNLGSGTTFTSVPNNSLTALTLDSGGGTNNSGTNLAAGGSRYFLVAVKKPSASFDNTYQNRAITFGLTWHIDQ
jgi:hypothetical protein